MVRRENFCNKLHELGYHYKRETEKVALWKRPGHHSYVTVPRRDLLDDNYVKAQLGLAGCSQEDAERFVATNQAVVH